jgi:CDP-diglyceride synthetase
MNAESWPPETSTANSAGSTVTWRGRAARVICDALAAQRSALRWSVLAIALAAALIGMGLYVLAVTGQPLSILVQDANAIAQQPNYFGALEHAGILLMSGAGWIALFTSGFCHGQSARFLFLGGLLSLLLAADDLYMFHESSWRFGMKEQLVFAFYAFLLLLLVTTSLRQFLRTSFLLLGTALVLFAVAIVLDASGYTPFGLPGGVEDCLELMGICFWSVYFVKCSREGVLERQRGTS